VLRPLKIPLPPMTSRVTVRCVADLWFVSVDTVRLKKAFCGARARAVARACAAAAVAARVRLVHTRILPFGMRSIVDARNELAIRGFVRKFVAHSAATAGKPISWRSRYRAVRVARGRLAACRSFIDRGAAAYGGDPEMAKGVAKRKRRSGTPARSLAVILRAVEAGNDAALGGDEVAARLRRYVADHDAPANDAAAFGRLCRVVFAQGLGFAVVDRRSAELAAAFGAFDPARVARFNGARIRKLASSAPIIRNEAKIRACVDNAKRWAQYAREQSTYLGRVAAVAAGDDAAAAWPALADMLQSDFVRIGPTAARQTLKSWGFFTAFANPPAHRLLARLGLVEADAPPERVQRLIGSMAQAAGRDVYAAEASLALFAGAGPCRARPRCQECPLLERCPTGSAARPAAA
jgi:3-methyladenine DNA glycosylase Tag